MIDGILVALGGIGVFLFEMNILTESLRSLVDDRLRRFFGDSHE